MNSFNPNYFIHATNILLLVAYSVRDILWLRLFAVAASLIAIPYFLLQPATLWAPLSWSVVFATINLFQAFRVYIERRPVKLTPEEEEVHRFLSDIPTRKVLQILEIGYWATLDTGQPLIKSGESIAAISLIIRGRVRVAKGDRVLGELAAGDLVGSALLLSGVPADVDAVAMEPVRAMSWQVETLQRFLAANPETRIIMLRHLASDLATKIVRLGRGSPSN